MSPVEILMTDKDIGVKTLTDMRALSLITFCLLGIQFLTSLSTIAEGHQQITLQVIQLDINTVSAAPIAEALTRIEPANVKGIVAYRARFGGFRALEDLLAFRSRGSDLGERHRQDSHN